MKRNFLTLKLIKKKIRGLKKSVLFQKLYSRSWKVIFAHFFLVTVAKILFKTWANDLTRRIFHLFNKKSEEIKWGNIIGSVISLESETWINRIKKFSWKFFSFNLSSFLDNLRKKDFVFISCFLVLIWLVISFIDNTIEKKIALNGEHRVRNLILSKFRRLRFLDKQKKRNEINQLVDYDSEVIGEKWEHLINHSLHSLLEITINVFIYWKSFFGLGIKVNSFFLLWLFLVNILSFVLNKEDLKREKKLRKELDEEILGIQKENRNITLIESMGLIREFEKKQQANSRRVKKITESFYYFQNLSSIIIRYLFNLLPYITLAMIEEGKFDYFSLNFISALMVIFNSTGNIIDCIWSLGSYYTSWKRVEDFLELPEKDDNLKGERISLTKEIKSINLEGIRFSYEENKEVLRNYKRIFYSGKINHLKGDNGEGKSTICYLILGLLTAQQGEISIKLKGGKMIYNLNRDVNLLNWREKNVSYCCYDNLIEKGSTGQKQIENFLGILEKRKDAQIWIFDEADNSLDKEKKAMFLEKLELLAKEGKIVIYIAH